MAVLGHTVVGRTSDENRQSQERGKTQRPSGHQKLPRPHPPDVHARRRTWTWQPESVPMEKAGRQERRARPFGGAGTMEVEIKGPLRVPRGHPGGVVFPYAAVAHLPARQAIAASCRKSASRIPRARRRTQATAIFSCRRPCHALDGGFWSLPPGVTFLAIKRSHASRIIATISMASPATENHSGSASNDAITTKGPPLPARPASRVRQRTANPGYHEEGCESRGPRQSRPRDRVFLQSTSTYRHPQDGPNRLHETPGKRGAGVNEPGRVGRKSWTFCLNPVEHPLLFSRQNVPNPLNELVPGVRFERTTCCLQDSCSTN